MISGPIFARYAFLPSEIFGSLLFEGVQFSFAARIFRKLLSHSVNGFLYCRALSTVC